MLPSIAARGRTPSTQLGRKLLVRILLFSMTLALFATLVQLLFEYKWDVGAIHVRLQEIEQSRVASIADSLWEFDRDLTEIQLQEILQLPNIARVELDTTLGEHFAFERAPASSTIQKEYPLYSPKRRGVRLGTMRVTASLEGVYDRLWSNALVILTTQSVKTFFVSLFILAVVHALVTRRLGLLAAWSRQLDVTALERPLDPPRVDAHEADELDDLAVAFSEMSASLRASFQEQQRAQERTRFLSEASRVLVDEVGRDNTARGIARLVAEKLAQASVVFTADEAYSMQPTAVVASSDELMALLQGEGPRLLAGALAETSMTHREQKTVPKGPLSDAFETYLLLPLVARTRTLGYLLMLFTKRSEDLLDDELTAEFATRAALALDNARLLGEVQRELSERIRTEEELRRSQEMFLQAQKMDAMGRLVASVAHDFNNLLSVVVGNSDLVLTSLETDHPQRAKVNQILLAGERGAALIRRLLAFGRKQVQRPVPVPLPSAIEDILPLLRQLAGEQITLELRASQNNLWVYADRVQLEQVLMNLVVNARDAIASHGAVTISCTSVVETEAEGKPTSEYVSLAVSDTGSGMDEATQARIFEPFFTTKALGAGTGLGLATVASIVAQSGGSVRVVSEKGKGSSFTVLLPRIAPPEPTHALAHESSQSVALPPRGGRVLVVDDDDLVRQTAATALREEGYAVHEAADTDAALELVHVQKLAFDLILSDVGLPRVSGIELVRQLRIRLPNAKVVLMSGYGQELIESASDLQIDDFLPKPFGAATLLGKVRKALAADVLSD